MVDEIETDTGAGPTVGERLKSTREEQGITLEEIAARTRIPIRHLESIEQSEWTRLPAATYTVGFAKNYAVAIGLDRAEIGQALREEMAGQPGRISTLSAEVYEPADPARVMPRWLVIAAVVLVITVVAAFLLLRQQDLQGDDSAPVAAEAPVAASPAVTTAQPGAAANDPVVITANAPVWFEVRQKGGAILRSGELAVGQSYEVPATATAPVLKTGKPEAIRISVGTADAPAIGAAATTVSDVSLLAADLMRGPVATASAQPVPPQR